MTPGNTCATCKHWRAPEGWRMNLPQHGECRGAIWRDDEDNDPATSPLVLDADTGYLVTLPTFGCVLHEVKT